MNTRSQSNADNKPKPCQAQDHNVAKDDLPTRIFVAWKSASEEKQIEIEHDLLLAITKIKRASAASARRQSLNLNCLITVSDYELQEIASNWSAKKLRFVAEKLLKWSAELKTAADLMDGSALLVNVN